MNEIYEFLKKCENYYLATVDKKQPRVRPFMSAKLIDDKLYILTTSDKNVFKQMEKNPKVELCAYDGNEWLRVTGEVCKDDSQTIKQLILDDFPKLEELYDADDKNLEILYLTNVSATISTFEDGAKKIKIN